MTYAAEISDAFFAYISHKKNIPGGPDPQSTKRLCNKKDLRHAAGIIPDARSPYHAVFLCHRSTVGVRGKDSVHVGGENCGGKTAAAGAAQQTGHIVYLVHPDFIEADAGHHGKVKLRPGFLLI